MSKKIAVCATLFVVLFSSAVDAGPIRNWIQNRKGGGGGGGGSPGKESFPANTPIANQTAYTGVRPMQGQPQMDCSTGTCEMLMPPTVQEFTPVPTIAAPAPPKISVVIETRTDPPPVSQPSTEARLADAEQALAKALDTVETLRRDVTRKRKIEVIDLEADVKILKLEQADELADMKRQLERLKTKIGGDLSAAEETK